MEDLRFMAIPADDRPGATGDDRLRLAHKIEEAGFALCDGPPEPPWEPTNIIGPEQAAANGSLWVAHDSLEATVSLDEDWVLQVSLPVTLVDVERDADAGALGLRVLIELLGVAGDVADPYVGFITREGEDLSFLAQEPPFEVEEPFALLYLGRRYLDDNGVPAFAADAAIDSPAGGGRVIVMDPVDLT